MCLAKLKISYVPTFTGDLIPNQKIGCKDHWNLKVPEFIDMFDKTAVFSLNLGNVAEFLQYNFYSCVLELKIDPTELDLYEGDHEIKYKLTDSVGESLDYTFIVTVLCFTPEIPKVYEPAKIYYLPPPKPFIKVLNQMGLVRIGFTRNLELPTFAKYPEFNLTNHMLANCTNGNLDCNAATSPNVSNLTRMLGQLP